MKNKTINLTAPRYWNELNEKQLIYASWLLTQGNMSEPEIWAYAFVRFTGLKVVVALDNDSAIYKKGRQRLTLTTEEVYNFARQFKYLTEGVQEIVPLKRLRRLPASDSRLRGATFAQYLACENNYQAYIFTKDEKYLNRLCACFYFKGSFDDGKTVVLSKKFARLPIHVRQITFLWFTGLKKVLIKQFPNYFVQVDIEEGEEPQAPNMRKQIENIMRTLSGSDVTKVDSIYKVETWTALAELDAKAHEYKVMQSRMKK